MTQGEKGPPRVPKKDPGEMPTGRGEHRLGPGGLERTSVLVVESAPAGRCPRDCSGAAGPAVRERQRRGEHRDDPASLDRFDDVWLDLDVPLCPATFPAVSAAVAGVE